MKKLIAFLMVVGVSASLMAKPNTPRPSDNDQPGNNDQHGGNSQAHIYDGTTVYNKSYTTSTALDTAPLTMTVTGSNGERGHAYFTTMSKEAFDAYNATLVAKGEAPKTSLVVQFLGTDVDTKHGSNTDLNGRIDFSSISDYGIYLYNSTTGTIGEMMSVMDVKGNYFDIGTDQEFGVYYTSNVGTWYSTQDYVGAFDNNTDHTVTVYETDENGNLKRDENGKPISHVVANSDIRFTCTAFDQKAAAGAHHWEFMLQTTLDNPYYNVDPNDFEGNGLIDDKIPSTPSAPSGQPLPGTLATLLIGGLCASAFRKKNQK